MTRGTFFGFGTNQPGTFGSPGTGFGTAAPAPGFGTSTTAGFGSTSTFGSTTTPTFGTNTTSGFGSSFGTGTFGNTTQTNFGTGGFGATTPAFGTGASTSGFGTAAPTSTGGFGTGTPSTAFGATSTAGGFGNVGFGAPTFGAPTTTSSSGFNFGSPKFGTTTAPAFGTSTFSLGATTTTAGSTLFNFGNTSTSTAAKPTFSLTPSKPGESLGGTSGLLNSSQQQLQAKANLGGEAGPPVLFKSVKESPVPPELAKLVEDLGAAVKRTKSEGGVPTLRASAVSKTSDDIESVRQSLMKTERTMNTNRNSVTRLKEDSSRVAVGCDTAQKTKDLAPGFQADNTGPLDYFVSLADRFQERVVHLRLDIENTEKHMMSALNPAALTPQDLNNSMKRLHECFVSLAGRMQLEHSAVQALKQAYIDLRRSRTGDYSDVFSRKALKEGKGNTSDLPLTLDTLYSSAAAVARGTGGGDAPSVGAGVSAPATGQGGLSVGGSLFGTGNLTGQQLDSSPFALGTINSGLQPVTTSPLSAAGTKRGKR